MSADTQKALQYETEFLSGVDANFEAAKSRYFRGSIWQQSQDDEVDRLKALMASHRRYDREALKSLPANRRVTLRGFERRFLFGKRSTGIAIASVLSPLSHYASGAEGEAPAIGLGELIDHVRQLTGSQRVRHVIGVCSPTGFTEEARAARLDMPNAMVVLIEPDGHGGWKTTAAGESVDPRLLQVFDPEGVRQKIERVRLIVEEHSADLLTGGLSVSSVTRKTGLPEGIVRQAFKQAADGDPELRSAEREGELLLFRGAPVQREERKPMNVIDRIRQLFAGEGDNAEKINLLAERRASLAQRRDRIYEDISKLETREGELLEQGKAAKSQVPRRRLAAQLAQMRKDIARQNATAAMLNKQIDIISTDIHNLTLIQQGEKAKLPDTLELTEHAVAAEEMLETLKADSELVGGLETGIEETLVSEEELAILKEFEGADAGAAPEAAPSAESTPLRQAEAPSAGEPVKDELGPEPPDAKSKSADPEAT
jgi:hypothetical protein